MTATPDLDTFRLASPDAQPASPDLLRSVFRQHAAGVAVITAQGRSGPVGFTATSLSSVSAEPPIVSFGIGVGASSWPAISESEHVGIHILGEHQQELAATFARSGADRFGAPPVGARARKVFPSSTAYWPGSSAGSRRGCRPGIIASCWPRSSSVIRPARAARCCTTRDASTACVTEATRRSYR
jgi:Conserved protein/domain typically associated with flavoprotein oxygenases, DIM6/NTAB family